MTAQDHATALLTVLTNEQMICSHLIRVAEAERAALLTNDADTLSHLVREMESASAALDTLEEQRTALVSLLGVVNGPAALTTIAEQAEPARAAELLHARDELRASMTRLRAINEGNRRLVEHALHLNERLAGLLASGQPATYTPNGIVRQLTASRQSWSA